MKESRKTDGFLDRMLSHTSHVHVQIHHDMEDYFFMINAWYTIHRSYKYGILSGECLWNELHIWKKYILQNRNLHQTRAKINRNSKPRRHGILNAIVYGSWNLMLMDFFHVKHNFMIWLLMGCVSHQSKSMIFLLKCKKIKTHQWHSIGLIGW